MFTVFRDSDFPTNANDVTTLKTTVNKPNTIKKIPLKLHSRSLSDSDKLCVAVDDEKRRIQSYPSSPVKRQVSLLETPVHLEKYFSNKENWDPLLQLYSNDRQTKKTRSISCSSLVEDRAPLKDITDTYQSRIMAASQEQSFASVVSETITEPRSLKESASSIKIKKDPRKKIFNLQKSSKVASEKIPLKDKTSNIPIAKKKTVPVDLDTKVEKETVQQPRQKATTKKSVKQQKSGILMMR